MKLQLCAVLSASFVVLPQVSGQDAKPKQTPAFKVMVETLCTGLDAGTGGMEVDAEGFVYSADFGSKLGAGGKGGDKIFKIDPKTGEAKVFVKGLRGASGNAIGPNGDLFQSSIAGNFISRITSEGKSSVFLRKGLVSPVGIAIDEEGTLFVANCGSGVIVEITAEGESAVFATSSLFSCPNGITLDDEHNLYVANFSNGDVLKISWDGKVTKLATLPGKNNGHLTYHDGALYVVARGAHQIYKVSLKGKVELFAGTGERGHKDGPALEATFSFPNDIAFSLDGKTIYINENGSTTEPHTELAPTVVRRIRVAK